MFITWLPSYTCAWSNYSLKWGIRFLWTHFSIFWIILKGMHVFFYWLYIQGLDNSFFKLETVLKFKMFIAYLYYIDNNAKFKSFHLLNVSMAGSIIPGLYLLNRLLRSWNKSRQLKENFHNNITIGDNSNKWFIYETYDWPLSMDYFSLVTWTHYFLLIFLWFTFQNVSQQLRTMK